MGHPRAAAIVIVTLVLGSCRGASGPSSRDSTRPRTTQSSTAGGLPQCLDEDRMEESPALIGDVDGDGSDDAVTVVVDPGGGAECRAFLVVRGVDAAPIDVLDESVFRLGLPAPNLIADIDGAPGKEIVVNVHAGASTQFASIFTLRGSRLIRVSIESADDLVPFGGSVAHLEGADCVPGGGFVIASASPRGRGYVVTRTFFEARGTALVIDHAEERTVAPRDLNSIPEFAGPPFGSCV